MRNVSCLYFPPFLHVEGRKLEKKIRDIVSAFKRYFHFHPRDFIPYFIAEKKIFSRSPPFPYNFDAN